MAVSELNEDIHDQICDLLENLQQIEKLKNKDIRILLDKIVRKYGGKVVNKWKRLLFPLLAFILLPNVVHSSHLDIQKKLIVTSESTKESIELAKYLNDNGVVKYSAYCWPNCFNQGELFGKQAYKELNVVECARDGINSQTQLCLDKKIKGFPTWEINGKLILGVLTLKELSKLTGFKN